MNEQKQQPMSAQEIAQQLNEWFLGGSGRVTQLPGPAAPSTRKYYKTHKGYDLAAPQGTQLNTKGLEYIGHGNTPGYGQRLAAYDPRSNRTYYFSHLSKVNKTPDGFQAFTGGKPGSFGAGNTTGSHVDIEYAQGKKPLNFSKMISRAAPQLKNTDYLRVLADKASAISNKPLLAVGSKSFLQKKFGQDFVNKNFVKL